MCAFRMSISGRQRQELEYQLHRAHPLGSVPDVKCLLAILAITAGQSCEEVAQTLRVTRKTVHQWVRRLLVDGPTGVTRQKPTGRPAKLTQTQNQELAKLLEDGPVLAGFASAGWRSPMIQQLIYERFGVFYNVFYLAQFLKNLGFRSQTAAFVSDHLNEAKRQEWGRNTWPQMLTLAKAHHALLLVGDEASFPQWGTLSYTWARRGHQPLVKT